MSRIARRLGRVGFAAGVVGALAFRGDAGAGDDCPARVFALRLARPSGPV